MQELINLIKGSKVSVTCMCNDRNYQKIRSRSNYTFELRFQRPKVEKIKAAMMSVCFKEKIAIKPEALQDDAAYAFHTISSSLRPRLTSSPSDSGVTGRRRVVYAGFP